MILSTVGFMFGTGGSAVVAKTFGEGDSKKGNEYFSLFVYVSAILGVIFAILGIVFISPIAKVLGAKGAILSNAVLYARIILIAFPFNILQLLFQSFCVTAEKPKLGLVTTMISGFTNMILDAVLVILLPQEYKLAGAALATAEALAYPLAKVFVSYDSELMEMTISGFRIFAISFIFMGYVIYSSGFFTALNDGVNSAIISFLRTLVFQIAAVLLLPLIWKINGVWISIIVSEIMAVVFSVLFLIIKKKKYHY